MIFASKRLIGALPSPFQGRGQAVLFHVMFLLVLVISYSLASHLTYSLQPLKWMNHYQLQANCLAHGRIGLCDADGAYLKRMQDASYYNGRVQAYWGPLPTLMPYVLNSLLGLGVSESAQELAITSATLYLFFYVLYFTLHALFRDSGRETVFRASLLGFLMVGFSSFYLHVASMSMVWFLSISSAQLFMVAHVGLLVVWLYYRRTNMVLALLSLAAGLSIMCKQALLPAYVVSLACVALTRSGGGRVASARSQMLHLLLPLMSSVLLLLAWNYIRFDDPFELGVVYQNSVEPNLKALPDPSRIGCNLRNYFLPSVEVTEGVPVLEFATSKYGKCLIHDFRFPSFPVAFPLMSILLLSVPLIAVYEAVGLRRLSPQTGFILLLSAMAAPLVAGILMIDASWMRYVYDVGWLLSLAAVVAYLRLGEIAKRHAPAGAWRLLATAASVAVAASLLFELFVAVDYVLADTLTPRFILSPVMERDTDAYFLSAVDGAVNTVIRRLFGA